jgi:serine/threonine-protein kinase HipA
MRLEVRYKELTLGILNDDTGSMLFQYDDSFIRTGVELSPFYLPLQQGVVELSGPFEGGLPGLFADSLPDYWGRSIMDRRLRESGFDPARVSVLKRLALVGNGGFGALGYRPAESEDLYEVGSLQDAVSFSRQVLELDEGALSGTETIQEAGSNPGGRFPKLCVGWCPEKKRMVIGAQSLPEGYVPCLLKLDLGGSMPGGKTDLCRQEFDMLALAEELGMRVPRNWLLEGMDEAGNPYAHFMVERFDRRGSEKIHMHSFSGIGHKLPVRYGASYEELLRLVLALTGDQRETTEQFRRMVFNVLLGNRDDHVRNHAFLLDGDRWNLSPAYDLTPTPELAEQSLSVNGKWTGIDRKDLAEIGNFFSIMNADEIIDRYAEAAFRLKKA